MSDIIKILPSDVSNKIAAGEVVQRPSSVLKELVENSIDANSTKIQIIIKDAGKNLIQVIDNGKGMSKNDMHLSFLKHPMFFCHLLYTVKLSRLALPQVTFVFLKKFL